MRRFKPNDYWYNVLMGGFQATLIIALLLTCFLAFLGFQKSAIVATVLATVIVTYYQWKDDNFSMISTGLNIDENNNLIRVALDALNWRYSSKAKFMEPTFNKYLSDFLSLKFIAEPGIIYLNFQYRSTSRTGRPPFFIGISSYYKGKFIKAVDEQLASFSEPLS